MNEDEANLSIEWYYEEFLKQLVEQEKGED